MYSFVRKILKISYERLSVVLTTILAVLATAVSYHYHKITSYNDATAHLDIARRIFDSLNPGLVQLGSVWLPLLHLLQLPFVSNHFLWQSGLAGSIVSGCSFVLASYFLFKLIYLLTKNGLGALIGSLALVTNLNFLYLQSTPMFEPLLLATILGALYFLTRWARTNSVSDLTLGAFWTMLATLTRYDGWAFFLAALLLIAIFILVARVQKSEGPLIIFMTLAGFGIILWLLYNFLIFHDPLYFQRGPYSAEAQQQLLASRGQLPAEHHFGLSVETYALTVLLNIGIIPILLGLIGLAVYLWREYKHPIYWFPLLLLIPLGFNVISLYSGQSVIWLPMLPPGFDTYFNARYGILMLPAVAFFIGYLASRQRVVAWIALSGVFLQVLLFAVPSLLPIDGQPIGLVTLKDTVSSVNTQTITASQFLHSHYRSGRVLVSSASADAFIFRADLPLKQIISEGSGSYWTAALNQPSSEAAWIVFFTNHSDSVGKVMNANPDRLANYTEVYQDPTYEIWSLSSLGITPLAAEVATSPARLQLWPDECIDTMKTSRDNARSWAQLPDLTQEIDREMTAVAATGANCVAIDTPYDPEFSAYLAAWVAGARQHGLHVWFRGNWSGWEGWFNYPTGMTPSQLISQTSAFITKNPQLFQNGDIFTAAPEAENGGPYTDFTSNLYPSYQQFLESEQSSDQRAFQAIGKTVTTNWLSINGGTAERVLNSATLATLGNQATIDHYIDDPALMGQFIDFFHAKGAKTVIGEFGAPIPEINGNMTEAEQATFVGQELSQMYQRGAEVRGVNYWTLSDGSTALLNADGTPRLVYNVIKAYYSPAKLTGIVANGAGTILPNMTVTIDGTSHVQTNAQGEFTLLVPAGIHSVTLSGAGYRTDTESLSLTNQQSLTKQFVLTPTKADWLYRLRVLIKKL